MSIDCVLKDIESINRPTSTARIPIICQYDTFKSFTKKSISKFLCVIIHYSGEEKSKTISWMHNNDLSSHRVIFFNITRDIQRPKVNLLELNCAVLHHPLEDVLIAVTRLFNQSISEECYIYIKGDYVNIENIMIIEATDKLKGQWKRLKVKNNPKIISKKKIVDAKFNVFDDDIEELEDV